MSRLLNVVSALLVLALGGLVYRAKTEAQSDQQRLAALEREVFEEQDALRVLRADIADLEDPARLRRLAFIHLGLSPIDPLRVVTLEEAPLLLEVGRAAWGRSESWAAASNGSAVGAVSSGDAVAGAAAADVGVYATPSAAPDVDDGRP